MTGTVSETFFLPDEIGRKTSCIPADIYNLAHTLLARSELNCVFVPIRVLQFLGVITDSEIIFVDSQAYAYNRNEGGRLIMLAWKFPNLAGREALHEPVDCDVLFYNPDSVDIQLRLIGDFRDALQLLDRRYRNKALPPEGARILKLSKPLT